MTIMLKQWLRWLWANEDGFFGIGQGPSKQEIQEEDLLAGAGQFATGEGEADITASDKFWQAILSGDPGQIAKVLGPEMTAVNRQNQQQIKTTSEFGNRSGGNNASIASSGDRARSQIDDMIAKLTGTGASELGSRGTSLLGTGVSADSSAFSAANTIQQQNASKWNDIFKSAASVAAAPFTGGASLGMGALSVPGGGGGGGGMLQSVPSDPTNGDFGDF